MMDNCIKKLMAHDNEIHVYCKTHDTDINIGRVTPLPLPNFSCERIIYSCTDIPKVIENE